MISRTTIPFDPELAERIRKTVTEHLVKMIEVQSMAGSLDGLFDPSVAQKSEAELRNS